MRDRGLNIVRFLEPIIVARCILWWLLTWWPCGVRAIPHVLVNRPRFTLLHLLQTAQFRFNLLWATDLRAGARVVVAKYFSACF